MTDWELQQVTDTLVMAREKRLMPTISEMLIGLSGERAALLNAAKAVVRSGETCSQYAAQCSHCDAREALEAAIAKAES